MLLGRTIDEMREHLDRAIENDPDPLSPRQTPLKATLAKHELPEPRRADIRFADEVIRHIMTNQA